MHPTQQHILSVLKRQSPRRYRDLIPKGMDGNTFTHHLRSLISDGLVAHEHEQYELTLPGMQFVDSLSSATLTPRKQPKIMVEVVYANPAGEWLLVEQITEPFPGKVGFPCGRLHVGERLEAAARRDFTEQTGLIAGGLSYHGSIAMETRVGGETVSHLITHIFRAESVTGELIAESRVGKPFFSTVENLAKDRVFPGLQTVIDRVNRTSCELTDEVFTIEL